VRPPLAPLDPEQRRALQDALREALQEDAAPL
jgi:hypothetical protein